MVSATRLNGSASMRAASKAASDWPGTAGYASRGIGKTSVTRLSIARFTIRSCIHAITFAPISAGLACRLETR